MDSKRKLLQSLETTDSSWPILIEKGLWASLSRSSGKGFLDVKDLSPRLTHAHVGRGAGQGNGDSSGLLVKIISSRFSPKVLVKEDRVTQSCFLRNTATG